MGRTFYHLWYFPALLWGALIARWLAKLGPRAGVAAAGLLYLAGLGGDSYFGLIDRVPPLSAFYAAVFRVCEYTRNGLFYAPLFLLLGAALAGRRRPLPARGAAAGLCLSFAAMTAEALWLRSLGAQRHDSMYLLLPVVMVCLFSLLLARNAGRNRAARDVSLLVYLLHPGCIVAVRGLAPPNRDLFAAGGKQRRTFYRRACAQLCGRPCCCTGCGRCGPARMPAPGANWTRRRCAPTPAFCSRPPPPAAA